MTTLEEITEAIGLVHLLRYDMRQVGAYLSSIYAEAIPRARNIKRPSAVSHTPFICLKSYKRKEMVQLCIVEFHEAYAAS